MIIRGCTISSSGGTGVYSDGVHIEIYETLIGENSSRGVYLSNSSSNSRVQNCHILDNGSYGIEGYRFEVMNTTFTNNGDYAVRGGLYTIEESLFTESMMGIYGSNITVFNNVFEGQFYTSWFDTRFSGICINGDVQISHNVFSGYQTGICVRASTEVSISIQNNLITENYRGIYFENVDAQNLICSDNNIYGNLYWNVYNDTNQRVAITDSFWGTDNENVIKNKIFDYYEDPNKGPVSFTGFKSSLVDGATSSKRIAVIPYNRQAVGFVDEVIVEWTAYDPNGLIEEYDLHFNRTQLPEILVEDAISPVTIPVEYGNAYYIRIDGFDCKRELKTDLNTSEVYTGLTVSYGDSTDDRGYSVVETSNGCLVVTGRKYVSGGGHQVYLLKIDSNGTIVWERNFGGYLGDCGYSVDETSDGGLVVVGYTDSSGNDKQVYLLKTDSNGNFLWEKNFGGSSYDYGSGVIETSDGGLAVAGYTGSFGNDKQVYLLKTDLDGNLLWQKTFGSSSTFYGYNIVETKDGGLVVAASKYSQIYLLKTDSNGNLLWEEILGGSIFGEIDRNVVETTDGGLVVTGYAVSSENTQQVYLVKTDSDGTVLWEKNFGGTNCEYGYSVVETSDSGLVVTGYTESFGNDRQVYLLKTDSNGDFLWEKNFGGYYEDYGCSVVDTSYGGLVVVGYTGSFAQFNRVYMIWTDSEGNGISEPGW